MKNKNLLKNFIWKMVTGTVSLVLFGSLFVASSKTVLADEGDPVAQSSEAEIYEYTVVKVIVPTTLHMAFNPEELVIDLGNGTTTTKQIASTNYGIVNKGSADMDVSVSFQVTDLNGKVTFVDSYKELNASSSEDYAIFLTACPANGSGVTSLANGKTFLEATGADLTDVNMTASDIWGINAANLEEMLAFKLDAANWDLKAGQEIILGQTKNEDLPNMFELKALGANSVSGFTFDGALNKYANWAKLGSGINIIPTYKIQHSTGEEKILEGTNAAIAASSLPGKEDLPIEITDTTIIVADTTEEGVITYDTEKVETIEHLYVTVAGQEYDIRYSYSKRFDGCRVDSQSGTVTLSSSFIHFAETNGATGSIQVRTEYSDENGVVYSAPAVEVQL